MPESHQLQPGTLLYIECMKLASEEGFRRQSLLGKLATLIRSARTLRRAS